MKIIETPENKLETLLRLAAGEPGHRPEFYKLLMQSPLFVLGEVDGDVADGEAVPQGSDIALLHWEKEDRTTVIPVFTSLYALQESIDGDERFLEIPARVLFEMTLGEELVMNPDSEYGKVFTSTEVEALLAGDDSAQVHERVFGQDQEVIIGQPELYPAQLIDSLTVLFSKHSNVRAAYLGLVQAQQDAQPNLIIGLSGDGDLEAVIQEAGAVAWDTMEEEAFVDFMIIDEGDNGIGAYFLNDTTPFYDSRWGSKMAPYTEPGKA